MAVANGASGTVSSLIQKSKSQMVMVHRTERIQIRLRILHPGTVAISSMFPLWSAKTIVSNTIPTGKTTCAIFKKTKATTNPLTVRIAANNNAAASVVQRMSVIENFISSIVSKRFSSTQSRNNNPACHVTYR